MFSVKGKYALMSFVGLVIAAVSLVLWLVNGDGAPVSGQVTGHRISVVVLDAGHGGVDGGTVGRSGTVEKDVNLEIVLAAREFCDYLGIETVLTREEDISLGTGETLRQKKVSDLRYRVELVNSLGSVALISVHQNYYDDYVSRGAQVFYNPENEMSRVLAVNMQARLIGYCDKDNARKAMPIPNDNYLLKNVSCPAVIVECGFLSHLEEEMMLNSPEYRSKLAFTIAAEALECVTGGLGGTGQE